MEKVKVIAFDADDTLWVNEPFYREAEDLYCSLLKEYMPEEKIADEFFKTEMENLEKYGYGAKGFVLSMIETAIRISNNKVTAETITKILNIGKSLLESPVKLLDDIEYVLTELKGNYRLIVATKGDLIDQQRKLNSSGLLHHFSHIEIMHDKNETEYQKLITRMGIDNTEFLMVGNSLKSDVLPVLSLGAKAVHVPFHITWQHEAVTIESDFRQFPEITKLSDLLALLPKMSF